MTLFDRALKTEMHSRFIARAEDLGRSLTDEEVKKEAAYYLETLPYSGYDSKWIKKTIRQMKRLLG